MQQFLCLQDMINAFLALGFRNWIACDGVHREGGTTFTLIESDFHDSEHVYPLSARTQRLKNMPLDGSEKNPGSRHWRQLF
ncbi:hypothetical protein CEXT_60061 [Caerostris extrusa]|uniref:Uncharacterized protein n=1 Tax=Caerostris extrusa TaxID=172846 RepID=A0AAV4NUY9_CAEEX|nr:hypothetical protein CEXT_60061 [Caerostris extrusa]